MIISKPLNNNVVMAYNNNNDEIIVVGTGIGFQAKEGQKINEAKVQKVFVLKEYGSRLTDLIEEIPIEFLEITELIVEYAKKEYDVSMNDKIYLMLTDHLYFAIERQKEGITLDNPFLYDVKQYCQDEYKIALYARDIIKEKTEIEVSEDEVGYIAMHIFESVYNQEEKIFQHALDLINEVLELIQKDMNFTFDENSLQYNRLKVHVNHFARRYLQDVESKHNDSLMDETIQQVFQEEYACVKRIAEYLKEKYGREMTNSEMNYLILHIRNCRNIID